jgi:hypothetical protein
MSFGVQWLLVAALIAAASGALAQSPPTLAAPEDVFRLLPQALEGRDRTLLGRLLASGEIRARLNSPSDRQSADLYSAEQVLYMLDEFLRDLRPPAEGRLDVEGYRSDAGSVVCECDPTRARNGRAQGVLHLIGERDRRNLTLRLYLSLREGRDGWRVVELRLLP